MVDYYCRKKENNKELCADCRQLIAYAQARLDRCPFGEGKSACKKCTIHCYKPDMRQRMRKVMAYTGPRMFFAFPKLAFAHYLPLNSLFRSRKSK